MINMERNDNSEDCVMESSDNATSITSNERSKKRKKKVPKKGIVYLSTIPPFMNVTKVSELMSQYGEVGRVFLQPGKSKKPGKPAKHFTEGWVEFLSKRVAKEVAEKLNNTMIGGRKKSRFYDYIWNLKYLPRFKWVHLNERLEYERAVLKQKLRTEIEQAKRESSHFAHTVELSEKLKKSKSHKLPKVVETDSQRKSTYKQRQTDEEIKNKKNQVSSTERAEFLKNLFKK